jgi:L-cysteine:1D-myo-inositol 2-amino-2-deoxy-alpha-D-glucopyranoside ligase
VVRELGETIDLHGGGTDLIFPHHECEAAQSEAATRSTFVRHWMHVGMVRLDGVKMSKSLGNLVFVHDLCKDWPPEAIRLAVISHHYRSEWDWYDGLMVEATDRLELWQAAGAGAGGDEVLDEVRAALDDDLDTPAAIAVIDRAASEGKNVSKAAALLGVPL